MAYMAYAQYQHLGLSIGSGVTEVYAEANIKKAMEIVGKVG